MQVLEFKPQADTNRKNRLDSNFTFGQLEPLQVWPNQFWRSSGIVTDVVLNLVRGHVSLH